MGELGPCEQPQHENTAAEHSCQWVSLLQEMAAAGEQRKTNGGKSGARTSEPTARRRQNLVAEAHVRRYERDRSAQRPACALQLPVSDSIGLCTPL